MLNFRISRLLTFNSMANLIIVAGIILFGFWGLQRIISKQKLLINTYSVQAELSAAASSSVLGLRRFEKDIFLNIDNPEKTKNYFAKWQAEYNNSSELLQKLFTVTNKVADSKEKKTALSVIQIMIDSLRLYKTGFEEVFTSIEAGQITTPQAGNRAIDKFKEPIRNLIESSESFARDSNSKLQNLKVELQDTVDQITLIMPFILLLAILINFGFSSFIKKIISRQVNGINEIAGEYTENIARGLINKEVETSHIGTDFQGIVQGISSITHEMLKPMKEIKIISEKMAAGDLTCSMEGDYQGEFEIIKESLNHSLEILGGFIRDVVDSAGVIKEGSEKIEAHSRNLADGSERQSSAIEEISVSITQLANQLKLTSTNADKTNHLARDTFEKSKSGTGEMTEMHDAMVEIARSSDKIEKILKSIDEIAFQTNLLSLNAAVEAARAGKHGKGFAVVASEVKNLSDRSSRAAKETSEIITDSIKKIKEGMNQSEKTRELFTKITTIIQELSDLMNSIASSTNDQTGGIHEIEIGMKEITNIISQNSQIAEETARASEEFSEQATKLQETVMKFKL